MNLFRLHNNPMIAAEMHCDKHIPKMILETAQMLSTAWRMTDEAVDKSKAKSGVLSQSACEIYDGAPEKDTAYADEQGMYKIAYKNHPSTVWVRQKSKNYNWTLFLFKSLCKEYTKRYGKHHASGGLESAFEKYPLGVRVSDLTKRRMAFPQCMPDEYKVQGNPVKAYRNYYKGEKAYFDKWDRGRAAPKWWPHAA